MRFLDTALTEISRVTEILMPTPAGAAFAPQTRAADMWDDQVTDVETVDARRNLHDFSQALVADYEVIIPVRHCAVLKGTDLSVGATDADFEYAECYFIWL